MIGRLLSSLLLFLALTANAQLAFEEPQFFSTKVQPNFMELGDLDGDLTDDFMIANKEENFITIMLKATGYTPVNIVIGETGALKRGITFGDFDDDGNADLAVTDLSENRIAVLLGTGGGEFAEPVYYTVGLSPVDIATADFDGDGDLDLVTANSGIGTISILSNNGSGTFAISADPEVQDGPETVEFNDIDNNGTIDIIVVNNVSHSVSVLIGNEVGEFATPANYVIGENPTEFQIADVNDDTHKDIVVVHDGASSVSILYGLEGVFDDPLVVDTDLTCAGGVFSITDINEDTFPDIAIGAKSTQSLNFLMNDGFGSFTASTYNMSGEGYNFFSDVIARDLFDNGHLSLWIANTGSIAIVGWHNDGTGEFNSHSDLNVCPAPYRVVHNDLNNDGYEDIVSANRYAHFITIYMNDTHGGVGPPINLSAPSCWSVETADIDDDGYVDIIAGGFETIRIFYGDATYEYGAGVVLNIPINEVISIDDINNDGNLDISTVFANYLGDGNRQFSYSDSGPLGPLPNDVEVCDLNADGNLDWITSDQAGDKIQFYAGNGNGTFAAPVAITVGNGPYGITSGYFDDDLDIDIAVTNQMANTVSIILGGSGVLAESGSFTSCCSPTNILATDVDGDGETDLLVSNVMFFLGVGDGSFGDPVMITSSGPQDATVFDFDGNGGQDLVVASLVTGGGGGITLHLSSIESAIDEPLADATALNFPGGSVAWTNGDGEGRIVVAKAGGPVDAMPADDVTYDADASFGSGEEIGAGNFVLYDGSGSTFTVLNLEPGVEYHYAVFEYNRNESGSVTNYRTSSYLSGVGPVKIGQTITFNAIEAKSILGSAEFELTATASSGLTVTYTSSDPLVATVDGNVVTILGIGTTTITASQAGNELYLPAPAVTRELVVTREEQIIAFEEIPGKLAGDVFELQVSSNSGLDLELVSDNPIATIDGVTVTLTGSGTVTITASHPGDDYYQPAAPVSRTFEVSKKENVIAFTDPADKTLGFTPFELEATATSELAVVFSSTSEKITISGSTVTGVSAGRVAIVANEPGNDVYEAAPPLEQSFCINPPMPVITLSVESDGVVLTSDNDTGNQWTFNGNILEGATGSTLIPTLPGSYSLIVTVDDCASEGADDAFLLSQSISFDGPEQQQYLATTEFQLIAGATSNLPVTFTSSNPLVATVEGEYATIVGPGTTTITASQAGGGDYLPAASVSRELVVIRAEQIISFEEIADKAINDVFEAQVSTNAGLDVELTSDSDIATIDGKTITVTGSGTVTITATQAGNDLYLAAESVSRTFEVKQANTITFNEIGQKQYLTDTEFELIASASSGFAVTFESSDPLVATVSGNVVTIVGPGTTTITAYQEGDGTFVGAQPVSRELLVIRAEQYIEFAEITDKVAGDVFELEVSTTAQLDVDLESDNEIATIDGKTVTLIGSGTVTITARQIGNGWYLPAAPVSRTFEVSKKSNAITFAALEDKVLGFAPFNLEASATSELAVVFSTTSDEITISDATVTGVHAGRATIVASQPGNDAHVAAEPVEQTFCINPPKPVITVAFVDGVAVMTSSNDTGNRWKQTGVDIEGAFYATMTFSAEGSYTVVTTIDDCVSEESEPVLITITGLARRETGVKVYPNPAVDFLHVEVASDMDESLDIVITDVLGRVMFTKAGRTNTTEVIDVRDKAVGTYVIRMVTGGETMVERFKKH